MAQPHAELNPLLLLVLAQYGGAMLTVQAWEAQLASLVAAAELPSGGKKASSLERAVKRSVNKSWHLLHNASAGELRNRLRANVDGELISDELLDEISNLIEDLVEGWPPFEGARAQLAWHGPDGTARDVRTASSPYLTRIGGHWLLPAVNGAKDVLSPILLWWCLLHALSQIARYHSDVWLAALNLDSSPCAVSIERVLSIGLAVVPRLVLLALSPGAFEL